MFSKDATELVEVNKFLGGVMFLYDDCGNLVIDIPGKKIGVLVYKDPETNRLMVVVEEWNIDKVPPLAAVVLS
jgi:hypothetical protein